jgi:type IV fimbrial biogenesis protein FimT
MHIAKKNSFGFSLLELLVTVVVLGILLTAGVPSMMGAAEKRRTIAVAEAVYSELQMARSAAVAKSQPVFVNVVDGADWAIGVSTDPACDPTDNNPGCTLSDVDNNNAITHLLASVEHPDITLNASSGSTSFMPQRGIASAITIDISSTGRVGYTLSVRVGVLGQVSLCSSDADPSKHVTGYRTCA